MDVVAGRNRPDGATVARLVDEAADVAALHVQQHGHQEQAILGGDHRRADPGSMRATAASGTWAARCGDEHLAEGRRVVTPVSR